MLGVTSILAFLAIYSGTLGLWFSTLGTGLVSLGLIGSRWKQNSEKTANALHRIQQTLELNNESLNLPDAVLHLLEHHQGNIAQVQELQKDLLELQSSLKNEQTAQKQLKRERDRAVNQLQQSQLRGQAHSDFLNKITHELRTPLNALMGTLELLSTADLQEHHKLLLLEGQKSGNQLLSNLNDMLMLSKVDSQKFRLEERTFNAPKLIGEMTQLHAKRAYSKGIDLIAHIDESIANSLIGDAERFKQIAHNLISNAIKFTHSGQVIVHLLKQKHPGANDTLRLAIKDTGIGFSEQQKSSVLELFTADKQKKTRAQNITGLGLNSCHKLANKMNAKLGINSELGKGSELWIDFDLPDSPYSKGKSAKPEWLSRLTLLVVGCNPFRRRALKDQLTRWQIPSTYCATLGEALQILETRTNDQYLLLLDGNTPPHTSPNILASLGHHIQLVDESSFASSSQNQQRAFQLKKPIQSKQLLQALNWCVERKALALEARKVITTPTENLPSASILVAEDNVINQKVMKGLLLHLGMKVKIVDNGQEALEAFRNEPFHMVMMDCHMPKVSGFQASLLIRQLEQQADAGLISNYCKQPTSPIPIIAVSASLLDSEKQESFRSGMNALLDKPFTRDELKAVLHKWLPKVEPQGPLANTTQQSLGNETPEPLSNEPLRQKDTKECKLDDSDPESNFPSTSRPSSLDPIAIERIRSIQRPGTPDLLVKIIDHFLNSAPNWIEEIKKAAAQGNVEKLGRAAHSFKSASANLGALSVSDYCKQLEQLGHSGSTEGAHALLEHLETAYKEAVIDMKNEAGRTAA